MQLTCRSTQEKLEDKVIVFNSLINNHFTIVSIILLSLYFLILAFGIKFIIVILNKISLNIEESVYNAKFFI